MWGEDIDIGLSVEDAEAARVVAHALQSGCTPLYRNANGTFLELHFQPSQPGTLADSAMAQPAYPVLYGYLEKLCWTHYVQICHEVSSRTGGDDDAEHSNEGDDERAKNEDTNAEALQTRSYEVDKPLDFILHVRSSPEALLDREGQESAGHAVGPSPTSSNNNNISSKEEEEEQDMQALEQRADKAMIRNAVDTVLRYGEALRNNPLAEEQIYVDEANERQYIRFVQPSS